jgi:hypothetical protein
MQLTEMPPLLSIHHRCCLLDQLYLPLLPAASPCCVHKACCCVLPACPPAHRAHTGWHGLVPKQHVDSSGEPLRQQQQPTTSSSSGRSAASMSVVCMGCLKVAGSQPRGSSAPAAAALDLHEKHQCRSKAAELRPACLAGTGTAGRLQTSSTDQRHMYIMAHGVVLRPSGVV